MLAVVRDLPAGIPFSKLFFQLNNLLPSSISGSTAILELVKIERDLPLKSETLTPFKATKNRKKIKIMKKCTR